MATTIKGTGLSATSGPRAITVTLWMLRGLLGAMFILSGVGKISGAEQMVGLFNMIGLGEWFRYFTGAIEVAAGAALFTRRFFGLGAAALMPVMIGAAITHVIILDSSPATPLVLLLGAGAVIWLQRARTSSTFTEAVLPSRS